MKPIILLVVALIVMACAQQTELARDQERKIYIEDDLCAKKPADINIGRSGRIKWQLDPQSPGYNGVEKFGILFGADNPTNCSNEVWKDRPNQPIQCTIREDAEPNRAYCYRIGTKWTDGNGNEQSCTPDPTIFVNGQMNDFEPRECDKDASS